MQIHQREKCLRDSQEVISQLGFPIQSNKAKDLIRLVYEISIRDNISAFSVIPNEIISSLSVSRKDIFKKIKNYLIQKRFPEFSKEGSLRDIYLPKIAFDPDFYVPKKEIIFSPHQIFVERQVVDSSITKNIIDNFKKARVKIIDSLPHYLRSRKRFTIRDYNQRHKTIFLIKENYDFLKSCPCTKGCICCGYVILNIGFGCIYECSYCFLQGYTNAPGIVIPTNIEDFLSAAEVFIKKQNRLVRLGTGEFTDSLALDYLTGFSKILVPFFAKFNNVLFELKTKSSNINNLLGLVHNGRTVVSWSLNPQSLIKSDELGSSDLNSRIASARRCVEDGYLVAFHFDPILYSRDWLIHYSQVIDLLFSTIKQNIAWISLGTLRFPPILKPIIEQRFPETNILNEELIIGFDKKIRYPQKLRISIYTRMVELIRRYDKEVSLYLCMENPAVWKAVFKDEININNIFSHHLK